MRVEAAKEEWEKIYGLAAEFKRMQPWKILCSNDYFCLSMGEDEDVYVTILGNEGLFYGFCMYVGMDGFNDMLGIAQGGQIGVSEDYMAARQNCISMVFADREEVPQEQYEVIRELGLKFRGRNGWIYFETYERGFFPSIPDQDEVRACIKYLEKLLEALQCYMNGNQRTFAHGMEMFVYVNKNGTWQGEYQELPYQEYQCRKVLLEDEEAVRQLLRQKKTREIVEMDCIYLINGVEDEAYDKPIWPHLMLLVEKNTGMILKQHLFEPQEDDMTAAQVFAEYILEHGRPKEVIVPHELIGCIIADTCEKCKIKLTYGIVEQCRMAAMDLMIHLGGGDASLIENEQALLQILGEAGLDIEKLKKNAKHMSEEEFYDRAMEDLADVISKFIKDIPGYGFMDESFDFLQPYQRHSLKNRKQKIKALQEFFGQGEIPKEEYELYEKWIEVEVSKRQWKSVLKETAKDQLYDLAFQTGALVDKGYTKDMLVDIIIDRAAKDAANIKKCLSKEEIRILKKLYKIAGRYENEIELEEFPYSAELVQHLLEFGLIDIGYGTSSDGLVLTILTVEDAMRFWKI